jgi:hypothetical protein
VSNKILLLSLLLIVTASGSGQVGQWTTFGHDPQCSGYAGDEHAFSPANAAALGLALKTVVPNEPPFLNGLTAPLLVRGVKTAVGVKNLVIVAATSDHLFALNARPEIWYGRKIFPASSRVLRGNGFVQRA